LLHNRKLAALAINLDVTAAQRALARTLRQPGLIPIPTASTIEHFREKRAAADLTLNLETLA